SSSVSTPAWSSRWRTSSAGRWRRTPDATRACAVPGSARSPTTWRSYDEPLRLAHAPYTLRRGNDNGGGGARVLRAAAWRHHLAGPRRDLPATGPRRAPDLPLADEGNRRGCGPCGPHHPWGWRWLTPPILRSS